MSAAFCLAVLLAVPGPDLLGPVHRTVLDNGMVVLVNPVPGTPLVSVGMMYRAGARLEAAGSTGLAHYVEHMNFRATARYPGSEITEAITRIGGRWNGYTWLDQTYYGETVARAAFLSMLDLERDRMTAARYDPEDFGKERTSVLAELHSYDDPHSVIYDAVLAASFEIHPYRNNTIGWLSDVEAVTRDQAHAFYRRYYHPNNAVLAIAGDVDPAAAVAAVRERFGALPAAGASTDIATREPEQTGQRRVLVRRPGPHGEVLLAFRAPALGDPDFPVMVVFDALVAGGKGFRFTREYAASARTPLARALVETGLATEATTDWQASPYPYVYTASATVAGGEAGMAAAEGGLWAALAGAGQRAWTPAEMDAARREIAAAYALDVDDLAGRVHQIAFFEVSGGVQHLRELPARLAAATPDDVARFARRWLREGRATVGWFVPVAASGAAAAAADAAPGAERAKSTSAGPVAMAPLHAVTPSAPSTIALANGVHVSVAPMASGLVSLRARLDLGPDSGGVLTALAVEALAGVAEDDPAAPPLAWTLHRDTAHPANVGAVEVTASVLADQVPALLASLTRRLDRAGAGAMDWPRLISEAARRSREHADTASLALWPRALTSLYPSGSPLATPAWGFASAFAAADAARLGADVAARMRSAPLVVSLAGAVDPAALRILLDRTLGSLPRRASRTAKHGAVPAARGPAAWTRHALRFPGKPQDDLLVAWPGDRTRAWDSAATEAILYLLGETGYAGRLGKALVDPGLVYSVYATRFGHRWPGLLAIRTAAAPRDTDEVLRRIRAILDDAARGAFTASDLAEARAYLAGKRARAMDGTAATASTLVDDATLGLSRAESLTLDQLNDTARRLFARGAPLAIVAGPGD